MAQRRLNRDKRAWVIGVLLMSLALRSLVPVGFMPSAQESFSLQICPDGFPAQLLHHHHGSSHAYAAAHQRGGEDSTEEQHRHDPSGSEHCLFAAAAGVGPAPHVATLAVPLDVVTTASSASFSIPFANERYRIPQPRGPPSHA